MVQVEDDVKQAETFLNAVSYFKGNVWTMEFWNEKLAHRFPLYRWNGKKLIERNIQETQDNSTTIE